MRQRRWGVTGGMLLLGLARGVAAGDAVLVVPAAGPGVTPAAIAARYAAGPSGSGGPTGRGARIAVIAASDPSIADVQAFRRRHGLPPAAIDRLGPAAATADPTMTILLEWAGALAPEAPLTAIVGDPWSALADAILDDVAPILVVPEIDATPPDGTAQVLLRILYDRQLVAAGRVDIQIPGALVAEVLLGLAAQQAQTIVVPAGSSLTGPGVVPVGGTALRASTEIVWDDASGTTASGAEVAALASPIAPGYAYEWLGAPRCCAGGTGVAAALWGGVAALLADASNGAISPAAVVADAGRRQGEGGIAAFTDITEGVPPPPPRHIVFDPPPPAYDVLTGFGSPLVSGLVAAVECVGVECGSPFGGAAACGHDVCVAGGVCERIAFADGTPCTRDACTVGTTCEAGVCAGGVERSCGDGSACTADTCDPHLGCTHAAVADGATCQLLGVAAQRSCAPRWLVETDPEPVRARRVTCRDGDTACDHDAIPGQCTIHLSACTPRACPVASLHPVQPSARLARRSPVAAAARRALREVLGGPPATGGCSAAAAVVVPAAERVTLRVGSARQRSRAITLRCE